MWNEITKGVAGVMGNEEAERAFRQLQRVVGEDTAREIMARCFASAELEAIKNPQDLLRFGEALVEVGGFIGVVGRSFRVASICKGAQMKPGS